MCPVRTLPDDRRAETWIRLEAIERQASLGAVAVEGAQDILDLLAGHDIKTALVTNNSTENTEALMDRFGLAFDVVITRDSGLFKPSGAPLLEAMCRLGVAPGATIAVGDSNYDIQAAREAGCSQVIIVNGGFHRWGRDADRACENLSDLAEFLARTFHR